MKKKLLIMENDHDILHIVMHIFESQGYEVQGYSSEEGFLDKVAQEQPDAVLLDIIHPTLEGTELCRAIKAASGTKHIPVIVLSTHVKYEDLKKVCADDVLAKPFSLDELLITIQKQLAA